MTTAAPPDVDVQFGMVARFPFSTYRGRRGGHLELWPTTLRLFEALTNAAGTGTLARVEGDRLTPDEESIEALTWMEEHPPQALQLPDALASDPRTATYRNEGVFDRAGSNLSDRKTLRQAQISALSGPVGWLWTEAPPAPIAQRLSDLAADVAYLGEAECPAVVEVASAKPEFVSLDLTPTHILVETGQLARARSHGTPVPTPIHGRFAALELAYADRYPRKRPSAAQDRFSAVQRPTSAPTTLVGVGEKNYERCGDNTLAVDSPWVRAYLVPFIGAGGEVIDIPPTERTAWAVAMHRALVAQPALQYGVTPLVTGRYPQTVGALTGVDQRPIVRHTNRVGIQILDVGVPVGGVPLEYTTFAVMVPPSATDEEEAMLAEALTQLTSVYRGKDGRLERLRNSAAGVGERVSAAEFWTPPQAGMTRLWRTSPVAVPETRRVGKKGTRWTLADSCLLSVGFVFKDHLIDGQLPPRGEGYQLLRDAAERSGVQVLDLHSVRDNPTSYVHKLPEGVVAQPYRATIDLGELAAPTTLLAIGQSRHLGGGLLRPLDVPDDLAREWAGGAR